MTPPPTTRRSQSPSRPWPRRDAHALLARLRERAPLTRVPDTFLTYFNIRSILSNKSVQALVALSVFIPMTANQFDRRLQHRHQPGARHRAARGLAASLAVILLGAFDS